MSERLLVCTDLDRTLIPNGPEPESPRARDRFAALVASPEFVLAYVTGRHRQLVQEALIEYQLPQPDFVIGDVGTTIYRVADDGTWQLDEDWQAHIAKDWNGRTQSELQQLLQDIQALCPQEPDKQNSYKLSYYVAVDAEKPAIARAVDQRLQACSVRARQVWSVDEPKATGLLDILPLSASKYHAVTRLQQLLGFTNENTVFSGDSGNDIEVLVSPVPAVLVANGEAAVREQALREAAANGQNQRLYIASGGFGGMNGNYSAGILEGIAHFHPGLVSANIRKGFERTKCGP